MWPTSPSPLSVSAVLASRPGDAVSMLVRSLFSVRTIFLSPQNTWGGGGSHGSKDNSIWNDEDQQPIKHGSRKKVDFILGVYSIQNLNRYNQPRVSQIMWVSDIKLLCSQFKGRFRCCLWSAVFPFVADFPKKVFLASKIGSSHFSPSVLKRD